MTGCYKNTTGGQGSVRKHSGPGEEHVSADNLALSEQRATAVRDALVAADVRANRIETTAMGEESPRFSNEDAEGRTNNDRVEIIFLF